MMNNKFFIISIGIVLTIIIIICGILLTISNSDNVENNVNTNDLPQTIEVTRVKNRNDFFTVTNCVDRYITYLSRKDADILYNYLDEQYRKTNGITKQNILENIQTLNDFYKFKAREMYILKDSNEIEQYFVYGTLTLEATGDDEQETKFYISIKLDKTNNTFSVIPNLYIDNLKVVEE